MMMPGGMNYELWDCETSEVVNQVQAKALWTKTLKQADEYKWICTTPEGRLALLNNEPLPKERQRTGLDDGPPLPYGVHKKIERDLARMKMDDDERAEKLRVKMAADIVEIVLADIRRRGLGGVERDDLETSVANYLGDCDLGGIGSTLKLDLGPGKEATLDEYVNETLPVDHRARRELAKLRLVEQTVLLKQRADPDATCPPAEPVLQEHLRRLSYARKGVETTDTDLHAWIRAIQCVVLHLVEKETTGAARIDETEWDDVLCPLCGQGIHWRVCGGEGYTLEGTCGCRNVWASIPRERDDETG